MLSRRHLLLSFTVATAAPRLRVAGHAAEPAPAILRAETRVIEVHGKAAKVFGIRGQGGVSGLYTDVSRPFRVRLENGAGVPTLIHWHGLKPPYRQDGVPGVSGPLIAPGAAADYDFPLTFSGTYWMHSHQGFQEQRLMTAPLIIRDPGGADEQEIVILLNDFSFTNPEEIFAGLAKGMGGMDMSNMQGMPMGGGKSGMTTDVNDVAYDAFLANDRTFADPQIVQVEPGGRVRLRIINAASASNFMIDLGRLTGELIAVDGHPVQRRAGSQFPIAMGQRLDLRIALPGERSAYPVLAVLEGSRQRTGVVLAAPGAPVARLAETAAYPAPPLGFGFERGLEAEAPLAAKPADRVHRIDLTGSMARWDWGLNGLPYGKSPPLAVRRGERVEIVMTNKTAMSHPMHLHGHVFQVVAVNGKRFAGAMRDTVLVPRGASVAIAFDADNPGLWVFHCHNLYHMERGMMTTVRYQGT